MDKNQRPLLPEHLEIIHNEIEWTDFLWGSSVLYVKNYKV